MRLRLSPVWREVWECLAPLAIAIAAIGALLLITLLRDPMEDAYQLVVHSTNIPDLSGMARIEFLLNRYQTLIAGIFAIIAARMTVATIREQIKVQRQQIETQQRDAADQRLTQYAVILRQFYDAWQAVRSAHSEYRDRARETLTGFRARELLFAAMVDPLMGRDKNLVALLLHRIEMDALKAGDSGDGRPDQMIWVLFIELTNGIETRRTLLQEGADVSSLHSIALVDEKKYLDAMETGRSVRPT